jgi:hypothetical protein
VLLHSSGIHGVEGFAGSAIQRRVLEALPRIPEDGALALVHVLNPFGMAWLRRVNENNVDLNRNFLRDGEDFAGAPEGYRRLEAFLNPPHPPSKDLFRIKATWLILRHGLRPLKQAIAGGQGDFPRGLFFGGHRLEEGAAIFRDWVVRNLSTAKRVAAIDVHTGLGRPGEDTLIVVDRRGASLKAGGNVAYPVRGSLRGMLEESLPHAAVDFVFQEFGTYGPLRVLHALREENRWHHYGNGGLDHPAKKALKLAFCPEKESWQDSVLERGRSLFVRTAQALFGG